MRRSFTRIPVRHQQHPTPATALATSATAHAAPPATGADVPDLVKQFVTARTRVEKWWERDGVAGRDSHKGKGQREQLEALFALVQRTLGSVNEDVREKEARHHTMSVLTAEVKGGHALVTANRVLQHEQIVDMKAQAEGGRAFLSSLASTHSSVVRKTFKWYVFSDAILVCRPSGDVYKQAALYPIDAITVRSPEEHLAAARASKSEGEPDAPRPEKEKEIKPEVFFTLAGGTTHKCWAASEADAKSLAAKVAELQELASQLRGRATGRESSETGSALGRESSEVSARSDSATVGVTRLGGLLRSYS